MIESKYSINLHSHRFSAWAASRAASTSKKCRFKVTTGLELLNHCGFTEEFIIDSIPSHNDFDDVHRNWRSSIVNYAEGNISGMTDGVAAKLINTYLKGRFVCGGFSDHEKVKAIHPPIDSVLLKELASKNVGGFQAQWKEFGKRGWSNFSSKQYEDVIELIRKSVGDRPLWSIEYYWQGYQ